MRLELKNIHKIETADLTLGGLTVIAGDNDAGKSTVGKMLFSIVKAIARQTQETADYKKQRVTEIIVEIYNLVRNSIEVKRMGSKSDHIATIQSLFAPAIFFDQIKIFLEDTPSQPETVKYFLDPILRPRREFLKNININEDLYGNSNELFDQIIAICTQKTDTKEILRRSIEKVFHSEFGLNISSFDKENSEIHFDFEAGQLLITYKNNRLSSVEIKGELTLPYKDITYIETPLYLQISELIEKKAGDTTEDPQGEERFNPKVQFHIKDFVKKIISSKYNNDYTDELIHEISQTTNGSFVFDDTLNSFVFDKKNGLGSKRRIPSSSVASGIKSFGIIELLLKAKEIGPDKMLIWDEPENHLHPKWQLVFAELLIKLSNKGIPILVSSHSPYFIQAIRFFAKKNQFDNVKYHLADTSRQEDALTTIKDVSSDLNSIFRKLAQPMNDILEL